MIFLNIGTNSFISINGNLSSKNKNPIENNMSLKNSNSLNVPQDIHLRDVIKSDLPIFFKNQLDPEANFMVAFTTKNPNDKNVFKNHWEKILSDNSVTIKTIIFSGKVVGHISKFPQFGKTGIGYWIGKDYWGQGFATQALTLFLISVNERPLYARVAKDNIGSKTVLEKCGFVITGEDKGYSNSRGKEVEEYILILK